VSAAPITSNLTAGSSPSKTGDVSWRNGAIRQQLWAGHRVNCSDCTKSPRNPAPSYQRLSRYDETGLIWGLQGRPVIALTDATAKIEMPTGSILTYRGHNKPAYGPLGDSIDDFVA
jgi:hypothetical protein